MNPYPILCQISLEHVRKISTDLLVVQDIISKGAEATISHGRFLDHDVIIKSRNKKSYRADEIDRKLRKERSIQEVRILLTAREHELPVPQVIDFDKSTWTIIMEKLEGGALKERILQIDVEQVFAKIGRILMKLHNLHIIHGDLTTSNIFCNKDNVFLLDFGLGHISTNIEDKAVDLLVLKHTLESSHPEIAEIAFHALLRSYTDSDEHNLEIVKRMQVVENRVRYRSHAVV